MAVNYSQVFGDAGKIIKAIDQLRNTATSTATPKPDLPALSSAIQTQFVASGRQDVLEGMVSLFDGICDQMSSAADTLAAKVDQRLTHRESVVNQLPGTESTGNTQVILRELAKQMVQDSQTIQKSTVAVTSATAASGNLGTGTVVTTLTLDGVTEPSPGFPSLPTYKNKFTELAVPAELMSVTCITDQDNNGAPEGQEVFRVEGQPSSGSDFGWRTEGSGVSVDIPCANSYDILSNRDFELFQPNNQPIGWRVKTGTLGTTIIGDTGSSNVHRGTGSLKINGAMEIRQAIGAGSIIPGRMYLFAAAIKGTVTADGILTIGFNSDSGQYTPITAEQIVADAIILNTMSAGFTVFSKFWVAPATLATDLEFAIKYTGTNAGACWVDSVALAPVTYANGIGIGILAGQSRFTVGDRFTMTVTNTEGVMQRYFRRRHSIQLPSSASPTLPDSIAS